jgi:hypothetical protein
VRWVGEFGLGHGCVIKGNYLKGLNCLMRVIKNINPNIKGTPKNIIITNTTR